MQEVEFLTVERVNYYITSIFNAEVMLHDIPVLGEVSGLSVIKGNCYFTLKDASAQLRAVFFNCPIDSVPTDGEQIIARGSVDYYGKNGQLNFKVNKITAFGKGELAVRLERLKAKLLAEGIFDPAHKKPIPEIPRRVAVITSAGGAALHDFITTVRRYNNIIDLSVIDVRVQGLYAAEDCITALKNADKKGFDIIVLTRGGGSMEDLYCFNDENLVRTIFNMNTPVISAIGHEVDYTLCDFVADYRAITPTAAAEKIAFSTDEIKSKIITMVEKCRQTIEGLYRRRVARAVSLVKDIRSVAMVAYAKNESKYYKICDILEYYNPLKLLKDGYFRVIKDKNTVFDDKTLCAGDNIEIVGGTSNISATITEIKER